MTTKLQYAEMIIQRLVARLPEKDRWRFIGKSLEQLIQDFENRGLFQVGDNPRPRSSRLHNRQEGHRT